MKLNDLYSGSDGKVFRVTAIFNPNEENDPWVEYSNTQTGQKFSCRQEAFLSRFVSLPQPR